MSRKLSRYLEKTEEIKCLKAWPFRASGMTKGYVNKTLKHYLVCEHVDRFSLDVRQTLMILCYFLLYYFD